MSRDVLDGDRRAVGVVPQLHAVLLEEVRIASRLLDDRPHGVFVIVDPTCRGGTYERGACGRRDSVRF